MMSNEEIKRKIIEYLLPYHPKKIGLFGSFVRNEMRPDSDIDILIDLNDSISLFDLAHIQIELTEMLGRKADVLTEGALKNDRLRFYIERDLQVIYQ